jgi:hypothetical protein
MQLSEAWINQNFKWKKLKILLKLASNFNTIEIYYYIIFNYKEKYEGAKRVKNQTWRVKNQTWRLTQNIKIKGWKINK